MSSWSAVNWHIKFKRIFLLQSVTLSGDSRISADRRGYKKVAAEAYQSHLNTIDDDRPSSNLRE
jgi:hypothetical protein